MNPQSFANPFGPNASSFSDASSNNNNNNQNVHNVQPMTQLFSNNSNTTPNTTNRIASPLHFNHNSNNNIQFGIHSLYTNTHTSISKNKSTHQQQQQHQAPSYSNVGQIDVAAMLQNFGLINPNQNQQSPQKRLTQTNTNNAAKTNTNILQNVMSHLSNLNQSSKPNKPQLPPQNMNNMLSQLQIPSNLKLTQSTPTNQQRICAQTQPINDTQANNSNYPLFNMSMPAKTSTIGMNLAFTSTSHQIPLNLNIPPQQPPQPPPPLSPPPSTSEKEQLNTLSLLTAASNKIEAEAEESESDKSSVVSSSSSNVSQFLGHLFDKRKRPKEKSVESEEPPQKKRKLNDSEHAHTIKVVKDDGDCEEFECALNEIRERAKKHFDADTIVCESFIFRRSEGLEELYPHKLCKKLLKYGYDDEDFDELTASQRLKLFADNRSIMNMYQQYILLSCHCILLQLS